jgi:hypothetical protein
MRDAGRHLVACGRAATDESLGVEWLAAESLAAISGGDCSAFMVSTRNSFFSHHFKNAGKDAAPVFLC